MNTKAPAASDSIIRDRYQLQSLLGHGGMGMVWSAHDRRLDRTVALKLLRPDVPESTAAQMEREARAAARIDDQRIVTVLDLDHMEDGRPFLVLELHDGWTLSDELKDGPLHPERFMRLAEDLLGGLASAHSCGVMHRDIKPANLLAETTGFRITDFGLASIDTDPQTDPNLMGTLAYIAPERLHGAPGTFAADVFSASVVLYEAATGSKPFQAGSPADAIMAVRSRKVAPLPDHVPERLASSILLGLDPDPSLRPAQAGEMFEAVHGGESPSAETTVSTEPTEPLDQTCPLPPAGPAAAESTTTDMLRPRSGSTRTYRAVPADAGRPDRPDRDATDRRSMGTAARWRRPVLLVAAAVVLTLAFALGAIVSGGGDDTTPTEPAGVTLDDGPPPEAPAERLRSRLDRIEELGR